MPFLIGLALLVFAVLSYLNKKKFLKKAIVTKGEVYEIKETMSQSTDEDGHTSYSKVYYPMISFSTEKGEKVQFQSSMGSGNKRKYQVGQIVELLYDPDKPQKATLNKFFHKWFWVILFSFFSIIAFIAGFATL